jgi:hypothetical protein
MVDAKSVTAFFLSRFFFLFGMKTPVGYWVGVRPRSSAYSLFCAVG